MSTRVFITPLEDLEMKSFLETSIIGFIKELEFFAQDNNDPTLLGYCTERSLLSLYVSSLYRHFNNLTAIQEYKTTIEDEKNGRPDAFIKYKNNALIIESKFQDLMTIKQDKHWNIDGWLDWDRMEVYPQLARYFKAEEENLLKKSDTYTNIYLITMVFKYISEPPATHAENAIKNLDIKNNKSTWYYLYSTLSGVELEGCKENLGIEVYGVIEKKL